MEMIIILIGSLLLLNVAASRWGVWSRDDHDNAPWR